MSTYRPRTSAEIRAICQKDWNDRVPDVPRPDPELQGGDRGDPLACHEWDMADWENIYRRTIRKLITEIDRLNAAMDRVSA